MCLVCVYVLLNWSVSCFLVTVNDAADDDEEDDNDTAFQAALSASLTEQTEDDRLGIIFEDTTSVKLPFPMAMSVCLSVPTVTSCNQNQGMYGSPCHSLCCETALYYLFLFGNNEMPNLSNLLSNGCDCQNLIPEYRCKPALHL